MKKLFNKNMVVGVFIAMSAYFPLAQAAQANIVRDSSANDADWYMTCSTWATMAVLIVTDAQEKRRTFEESAATLYKTPDPFLLNLLTAAKAVTFPGRDMRKKTDSLRVEGFLIGYCYGGAAGKPLSK